MDPSIFQIFRCCNTGLDGKVIHAFANACSGMEATGHFLPVAREELK
jgi:hypothetical protein